MSGSSTSSGSTNRSRVRLWAAYWSLAALVATIGPFALLLWLGWEIAAVVWFGVAVLAVIVTAPSAMDRELQIAGKGSRGGER